MLRTLILVYALFVFSQAGADEFGYFDRHANTIVTTHEAAYHIAINEKFRPLGELHHRQASNGQMFKVSFAAYTDGSDIILIHAERLEVENGILSYDHLPAGDINGVPTGLREQCVPAEAAASLADNPEARFVTDRGFGIRLPFLLTQYLIASENGNAELVISYGRAIEDCSKITNALRAETRARVASTVTLEQVTD